MAQDRFRVIQGTYLIRGFRPDGDSVRFQATVPSSFAGLERPDAPPAHDPRQLRMEAIDAPETHYQNFAQPLGDQARDDLLRYMGFGNVRVSDELVTSSEPDSMAGVVLTQGCDPHGRPISYLLCGAGAAGLSDGAEIEVGADLLAQSLNARMIQSGSAYPMLYTSAPEAHRAWFREEARKAREQRLGVWARDTTNDFTLHDRSSLAPPSGALIFPKFFRRCMDYLGSQAQGGHRPATLGEWLQSSPLHNDEALNQGQSTSLAQLFRHQGERVQFTADLLDLVFVEK